jgi:hypothetical protein
MLNGLVDYVLLLVQLAPWAEHNALDRKLQRCGNS